MGTLLALAACGGDDDTQSTARTTVLPACYTPTQITGSDVDSHRCSWVHAALTLQRGLEADTPFGDAVFTSTHNSYNSRVYPGVSSRLDPNQRLSMSDQLSLDMDSIELDLHWIRHAASRGFAPVVCHGLGADQRHLGCSSFDNGLRETLDEIVVWLATPAAQGRVIWIDLDNVLDEALFPSGSQVSEEGHAQALEMLEAALGDVLYRPPGDGECHVLPLALTRQQVLDAGKQVILTSNCGTGAGWTGAIFNIRSTRTQKAHDGFAAAPACGAPGFTADDYATRHTRIWEDSTRLSALTNSSLQALTASDMREMLACGVNTVSLDQWTASDSRYPAWVWSWAEAQPQAGAGACARLGSHGRFESADCAMALRHACHDGEGWLLSDEPAHWGAAACGTPSAFAVPTSAVAQRTLTEAAAGEPVWVNYRSDATGQTWTAGEGRYR